MISNTSARTIPSRTLPEKNADALRDRTYIRIVAHSEDEHWLVPQCEKLHQILLQNAVPHEFCVFTNVKGHSPTGCMDTSGRCGLFVLQFVPPQVESPLKR